MMKGWDVFTMSNFIKFAKRNLRIKKIWLPTYETKVNKYNANPPMYLYKELPSKFGFVKNHKDSNMDGFMLYEQLQRQSKESSKLLSYMRLS